VSQEAPAVVGDANAAGVRSVKLSRQALDRIGIRTTRVREAGTATPSPGARSAGGTPARKLVPYSAVLYDPKGGTWVYTVPQPLTYIRQKVVVATVRGAGGTEAVLSEGPPAGTTIVSTGVIELYGAELGVGK
jgi:hypothetical protein